MADEAQDEYDAEVGQDQMQMGHGASGVPQSTSFNAAYKNLVQQMLS